MNTTIRTLSLVVATGLILTAGAGAAHATPPVAGDDTTEWDPTTGPCLRVDALANDSPTLKAFEAAAYVTGMGTVDDVQDDALGRPVLNLCPTGAQVGDIITLTYTASGIYDEHGQLRAVKGEPDSASATVTVTVTGSDTTDVPPIGRVVVWAGVGEPIRLAEAAGATELYTVSADDPAVVGSLGAAVGAGDPAVLWIAPPAGTVGEWTLAFTSDAGAGTVVVQVVDPSGPDSKLWTEGAVVPLETADEPTPPAVADPNPSVVAPTLTPVPVPAVSDEPTHGGENPMTLIGLGLAGVGMGVPLVVAGVRRVRRRAERSDDGDVTG